MSGRAAGFYAVRVKLKVLSFLVVAAAAVHTAAQAQQPAKQLPTVTTNGSAQFRVAPDLADLCFAVEIRNGDLAAARKEQAERATRVLAILRAAGITEAELQSSPVGITADYTDHRQETETIRFYRVAQTFCATLHDLKKVPDVTAEAVAAGVTGVQGVGLRTSQLRKYRDKARAQAVQAAKEKAIALAAELGAKVGSPYTITEGANQDWRSSTANAQNVSTGSDQSDDAAASFAPGTISVSANVTVTFVLE